MILFKMRMLMMLDIHALLLLMASDTLDETAFNNLLYKYYVLMQ